MRRPADKRRLHAWPGLFVAPLAFMTYLGVAYALVPWACSSQHHGAVHLVSVLFLAIALVGAWHGQRLWRARSGAPGSDSGDFASQQHFLGLTGALLSALFVLAILAQWFTAFVVPICVS